jgi:arylsulfatase A
LAAVGYTNVVLVVADGLGWGDVGYGGNRYASTPVLDQLAADGLVLSQHYTASPGSAAARAGLLTGRYSQRTGALSGESNRGLDRFSLSEATLADLFRAAGYATGMVGKWHNGLFDLRYHPNRRGFDEFLGFLNGGSDYFDWVIEANGKPIYADGRYLTDVLTEGAVDFVDRHHQEPFFLYVAYNAPSRPLQAPEAEVRAWREMARFNEALCRLYAMIHRLDSGVGRILEALAYHGLYEDTLVLFTSANGPWLGNERLGDGRTMRLDRDNGGLRGMRGDVLEGGIRVPTIVRWPAGLGTVRPSAAGRAGQNRMDGRLNAATTVDAMTHFCDWLPTLTAAAGVTTRPPNALDGINVLPVLQGNSDSVIEKRFWQANRYEPVPNCNAAMRDGPWKLYWPAIPAAMAQLPIDEVWRRGMVGVPHFETTIDSAPIRRSVSPSGNPELYRIDEDPSEKLNLALRFPDRLRAMQQDLERWFEEVHAERRALPDVWRGTR